MEKEVAERLKRITRNTRASLGKRVKYPQFVVFDMDMYPELILKEENGIPTVFICTDQHWMRHIFVKANDNAYAVTKVYGMDIKYITDRLVRIEELYKDGGVYYVTLGKNARFDESAYYPQGVWQKFEMDFLDIVPDEMTESKREFIKKNYT